jgi:hypothetical protein
MSIFAVWAITWALKKQKALEAPALRGGGRCAHIEKENDHAEDQQGDSHRPQSPDDCGPPEELHRHADRPGRRRRQKAPSDTADATAAAEAAYHKAVADEAAADAAADATYQSLKEYYLVVNKNTPQVLADYGLEPVVRQVPTAATKAAAAAKRKATLAARGVVGTRKRAAITAPAPAATPPVTPGTTPKP